MKIQLDYRAWGRAMATISDVVPVLAKTALPDLLDHELPHALTGY